MQRLHHVSSHNTFIYLWVIGAVIVLGGLIYSYIGTHPQGIIDGEHEGDVRTVVTGFGNQLSSVSLLAPDAVDQIRTAYGPFVSSELLAVWLANPAHAPGRMTSSPWPSHIETDSITQNEDGSYAVSGRIMLVSSTGDSGSIPVALTVASMGGGFHITGYEENPGSTPAPRAAAEVTLALLERADALGLSLMPEALEEDSRCPADVACIQEGTVRVAVRIVSPMGESVMTLALGETVTTEVETITFAAVTPEKTSVEDIDEDAYRFTFIVEPR